VCERERESTERERESPKHAAAVTERVCVRERERVQIEGRESPQHAAAVAERVCV
jgi:hypothetical protein